MTTSCCPLPLAAFAQRAAALTDPYPVDPKELIVPIADPLAIHPFERQAILSLITRYQFAFYTTDAPLPPKEIVRAVGAAFGLYSLDDNLLSDDDGITPIAVHHEGERARYIPYSEKPIQWHTDGYYNAPDRTVRGLILHCVRPAVEGGENRLLDPRLALYTLYRQDPRLAQALFADHAMTIPPGRDPDGNPRGESRGPVFRWEIDSTGQHQLVMRYTARSRNIIWADNPAIQAAQAALRAFLDDPANPFVVRARLLPGMGLICNNVLHTRDPFRDSDDPAQKRLLLRARYLERVVTP